MIEFRRDLASRATVTPRFVFSTIISSFIIHHSASRRVSYPFKEIEQRWQKFWEEKKTFAASDDVSRPKYYTLSMFPYPSASGLHVGHVEPNAAIDIVARYKRMKGFNVMNPMGWDAFGLPAEQFAVKTGIHPRITTTQAVATFKSQFQALGFSFDWDREVDTTDPAYYKWTQWIFLEIYNSWYDERIQKARRIKELIAELENEGSIKLVLPQTCKKKYSSAEWKSLGEKEQHDFLSHFRLSFMAEAPVNWCPELGTVLANEEVEEQREKGFTVERRMMKQWMMRITAYAERLLADLHDIAWSNHLKEMQRNWIGKSTGVEVDFKLQDHNDRVKVFTTRIDTIFGATFLVVAPEHPVIEKIVTGDQKENITAYQEKATRKSDLERTELAKEKSGVFTGAYAINPASGEPIPVWVADYVLMTYGTGAIMAVPAHDERDFEFAKKFSLTITSVLLPSLEWCTEHIKGDHLTDDIADMTTYEEEALAHHGLTQKDKLHAGHLAQSFYKHHPEDFNTAFTGDGIHINSASDEISINGCSTEESIARLITWAEKKSVGKKVVRYKLRDWLFSRQRYWGEPFPIIHTEDGVAHALEEKDLPLQLPEVESYKASGTGESPLATMTEWVNTTWNGRPARRETNTMPQWAGSCWYYLRYLDSKNPNAFCDKKKSDYWLPVDMYIGGAEHAVLHLLYARFWHKVLYDLGHVSMKEPFMRLFNQGMILGEDNQKMSKSRGNVLNPDALIEEYGADTLRLYEMFMGPLEATKPWSMSGMEGISRFLGRVWRLVATEEGKVNANVRDVAPDETIDRVINQTIKKVGEDIEGLRFNTAISQMMICVNELYKVDAKPKAVLEKLVLCLSPFAPHLAEECWKILGHTSSISPETFPSYDDGKLEKDTVTLVVQVNGKVRSKLSLARGLSEAQVREIALSNENVKKYIDGKLIAKVIIIKEKLVNVVVQ